MLVQILYLSLLHNQNRKAMKTQTNISDFSFKFSGYGHYEVTYISPITGKKWTTITSNMPLIDDTKNSDDPKVKDLELLKYTCKNR